jgi:N-methylhydantoinase B
VNPGKPDERVVGGKASLDLSCGDVVSFQLAGGGGYGDPRERERDAVLRDVRLGLVSVEAARDQYGVDVAAEPTAGDTAAGSPGDATE